jgi:hypothetical protein
MPRSASSFSLGSGKPTGNAIEVAARVVKKKNYVPSNAALKPDDDEWFEALAIRELQMNRLICRAFSMGARI